MASWSGRDRPCDAFAQTAKLKHRRRRQEEKKKNSNSACANAEGIFHLLCGYFGRLSDTFRNLHKSRASLLKELFEECLRDAIVSIIQLSMRRLRRPCMLQLLTSAVPPTIKAQGNFYGIYHVVKEILFDNVGHAAIFLPCSDGYWSLTGRLNFEASGIVGKAASLRLAIQGATESTVPVFFLWAQRICLCHNPCSIRIP